MKQYRILLFDVDGTLLDFEAAEKQGLNQVILSQHVEPTEELARRYSAINRKYWQRYETGEITRDEIMGNRFREFFETMGMKVDGASVEALYREQLNSCAILLDGALEICKYLADTHKYRMYVVTNGVSETQYKRLKASGLDQYFDDIFVSEDAGSQKPQKEYFDYCLDRISDGRVEDMLIIGDSLTSDIKGGNIAGIDTCWFNEKKLDRKAGIKVSYEIRKLEELRQLL